MGLWLNMECHVTDLTANTQYPQNAYLPRNRKQTVLLSPVSWWAEGYLCLAWWVANSKTTEKGSHNAEAIWPFITTRNTLFATGISLHTSFWFLPCSQLFSMYPRLMLRSMAKIDNFFAFLNSDAFWHPNWTAPNFFNRSKYRLVFFELFSWFSFLAIVDDCFLPHLIISFDCNRSRLTLNT